MALLPWPIASKLLILVSATVYVAALVLLAGFLPGAWSDLTKPTFLAYGLLFAPAQTALHVTNVACLSASFLFLGICLLLRQPSAVHPTSDPSNALHPVTAITIAVLLTLSLCIKPTLAPIVLLYLLCSRLWHILAYVVVAGAAICGLSFYPLLQRNGDWLASFQSNIQFVFFNGTADLAPRNLIRFDRIDLQLPAYLVTQSRPAAYVTGALISVTLLGLWFTLGNSTPAKHPLTPGSNSFLDEHLLRLSGLLVIGLLPTYQRFYSAILLLIPVLWAIRNLDSHRARWILALCSIFLINTSVLPRVLGLLNADSHPLFNVFIGGHICLLLLTIAILLVLPNAPHQVTSSEATPTL